MIESKAVKGVPQSALVYANPRKGAKGIKQQNLVYVNRSLEKWLLDSSEDKLLSIDFPDWDIDLKNYVRGQLYQSPW